MYTEQFVKSLIEEFIHAYGILLKIKKIIQYTSSKDTFYVVLSEIHPLLNVKKPNEKGQKKSSRPKQGKSSKPDKSKSKGRLDDVSAIWADIHVSLRASVAML